MRSKPNSQTNIKQLFVAGLFLMATVSCSKKEESAKVTMTMPDWSRASGKSDLQAQSLVNVVSRIMINVSAPDIERPIVYIWEIDKQDASPTMIPTPPQEIELIVPRGGDRLIQVLAITQLIDLTTGNESGGMVFHYGDASKTLANAVESVPITLSPTNFSSGTEGSISGRYLFADGSTPTGKVDMLFALPGKRPVIVQQTSIFGGYFHFFLLDGVPFSYQLENGLKLFDSITPTGLTSLASDRRMVVNVPSAYRDRGASIRQIEPVKIKLAGFFGPGAQSGTRQMCYKSSADVIESLYVAQTGGSLISWEPNSSVPSNARVLAGGVGATAGICGPAAGIGTEWLGLILPHLSSGDSPLGNHGPFQSYFVDGSMRYIDVQAASANSLLVKWKYLPQVVGNGVDGVGIFYRVFINGENMNDRWYDSTPCNSLAALGYTELTRVPATQANPVSEYTWANAPVGAHAIGRLKTLICPYSNSKPGYFEFALAHGSYSSGSPAQPNATQMVAASLTEPNLVNSTTEQQLVGENACTKVRIRFADSSRVKANRQGLTGPPQVTVVESIGSPLLFENADCTVPAGGSPSMNYHAWGSEAEAYVRLSGSYLSSTLNIQDTSVGGTPLPTISHFLSRVPTTAPTTIRTAVPNVDTSLTAWQCYEISFVRGVMGATKFMGHVGSVGVSLDTVAASGLGYFLDPSCLTPTSGPENFIGASPNTFKRYFAYVGAASTLSLSPTANSGGYSIMPYSVSVVQPASPTRLVFRNLEPLIVNNCVPSKLVAINSVGQYSPMTAPTSVNINYSTTPSAGEGLFSDPSCTTSLSSVALAPGQASSGVIYFRWTTAVPLSISGSGANLPVDTANVVVSPP